MKVCQCRANRSVEDECEYLLKCVLSLGGEKGCSCSSHSECVKKLEETCRLSMIRYPQRAIITPYMFFLYNRIRPARNKLPDWILINGTVRCQNVLINVTKVISFDINLSVRQMIEEQFCRSILVNLSPSEMIQTRDECHHSNEAIDLRHEWNPCLSVTRLNDGFWNSIGGTDEREKTQMEIDKSCARVRRHRLRCSREQPTCLSVTAMADRYKHCRNAFYELFFAVGRTLSSIGCHNRRQDQCSLLRKYIEQSWTTLHNDEIHQRSRIPFRSHCDTFEDLQAREDENLRECQRWWICPKDQYRCETGQCLEQSWVQDAEWDCADASDEHGPLTQIARWILQ